MHFSITQEQIENIVDNAPYQEAIFWNKEYIRSYKLPSGFTILGRAAMIDPTGYDQEIANRIAREDAINQLWSLEGYRYQCELKEKGML